MAETKYCKHCGQVIDADCVVCPKCGKQVEDLKTDQKNVIINNNNSSSGSGEYKPRSIRHRKAKK